MNAHIYLITVYLRMLYPSSARMRMYSLRMHIRSLFICGHLYPLYINYSRIFLLHIHNLSLCFYIQYVLYIFP